MLMLMSEGGTYLDGHQNLLLVWGQVVALGQEDFPEGALSQLPLQDDVVSLDVLDDCEGQTGTRES